MLLLFILANRNCILKFATVEIAPSSPARFYLIMTRPITQLASTGQRPQTQFVTQIPTGPAVNTYMYPSPPPPPNYNPSPSLGVGTGTTNIPNPTVPPTPAPSTAPASSSRGFGRFLGNLGLNAAFLAPRTVWRGVAGLGGRLGQFALSHPVITAAYAGNVALGSLLPEVDSGERGFQANDLYNPVGGYWQAFRHLTDSDVRERSNNVDFLRRSQQQINQAGRDAFEREFSVENQFDTVQNEIAQEELRRIQNLPDPTERAQELRNWENTFINGNYDTQALTDSQTLDEMLPGGRIYESRNAMANAELERQLNAYRQQHDLGMQVLNRRQQSEMARNLLDYALNTEAISSSAYSNILRPHVYQ
jgi:hypothetical protein